MRKFSAMSVVALLFLLVLCLTFSAGGRSSSNAFATSASNNGYSLTSSSYFNQYGQILVNETLNISTASSQPLSSVTFGFPGNYSSHIAAESAHFFIGATEHVASVQPSESNGSLELTLNLSPAIPSGTQASVSLGFYAIKTLSLGTTSSVTTNFIAPVVFNPSVNLPIDTLSSILKFPYFYTYPANSSSTLLFNQGYNETVANPYETWSFTTTNSTKTSALSWANVAITFVSSSSGNVDFQNVARTLTVDASGQVMVTDSLTFQNLGQNDITSLLVNFLTNSSTVNVEPSLEPPLSNVGTASVSSSGVDLGSIDRSVFADSGANIIFQYPLGSQYWSYSNGIYSLRIPTTPPVGALVDHFSLMYHIPSGYVTNPSPPSIQMTNTTGILGNQTFTIRRGIGSTFGYFLPLAGLFFIAAFIVGTAFRPRGSQRKAEVELDTTIGSLVKSMEDKVSGTRDILSELKSQGATANKADLVTARARIDELRSKSAGRFGFLRSELTSSGASQDILNRAVFNDREFDRAVRDALVSYDQVISRRMRPDTFAKVQQNSERRIQRVTNALLDSLKDVRREYEH